MPQTAVLERSQAGDVFRFEVSFLSARCWAGCGKIQLTMVLPIHILRCNYQILPSDSVSGYLHLPEWHSPRAVS